MHNNREEAALTELELFLKDYRQRVSSFGCFSVSTAPTEKLLTLTEVFAECDTAGVSPQRLLCPVTRLCLETHTQLLQLKCVYELLSVHGDVDPALTTCELCSKAAGDYKDFTNYSLLCKCWELY